jgi:ankyrin repeat protein
MTWAETDGCESPFRYPHVSTTDRQWQEFRDVVYSGDFARASEMLSCMPALLHMMNSIGETVLHFLAVENNLEGVSWLYARGADLDTKNAFGQPVLFEVASLGHKELFDWFVKNGVNTRATDHQGNDIVVHLLEYDCREMAEWVRERLLQ